MQPCGAAFGPRETTAEGAKRVKVTLQICKRIVSRRIVQTFFASLAGGAHGEDRSLDGFAATQPIVAADLEEANVALAAIEIPFKGRRHGDNAGGFKDVGFFGEWIGEARGLHIGWTEQSVAVFGDVGNGENF